MKREDFKIEGIPEGYRVYDVDLTPSGRPVAVLGHETDKTRPVFVRWHGADVPLTEDALWWNDHLKELVLIPIVRASGENHIVVVHSIRSVNNCSIFGQEGNAIAAFDIGVASEVLASDDWITAHYDDQSMTSPGGPDAQYEGIAVLDTKGNLQWGYESSRTEPKLDIFFHCAAWISAHEIVVFRDVEYERFDTACSIVTVNLLEPSARVWRAPEKLHGANAISVDGERVILHSPLTASGQPRTDVYEWRLDTGDVTLIGEWPWEHRLRGLPGGRFIAVQPNGYLILSFE